MINASSDRGIFISEVDLPPHALAKFLQVCKAEGKDPKQYLIDLILLDLDNFTERQKPLFDRAIEKAVQYVKKEFKTIGH